MVRCPVALSITFLCDSCPSAFSLRYLTVFNLSIRTSQPLIKLILKFSQFSFTLGSFVCFLTEPGFNITINNFSVMS